jgi:hypothetical protein
MTFAAMTATLQFKSLLVYCIISVLLEGEQVTEEMAARFVSMIPMIGGSTLFPGLFDIWLTSDVSEVMKVLSIGRYTVVQLVEALRYNPVGCGFDSQWGL